MKTKSKFLLVLLLVLVSVLTWSLKDSKVLYASGTHTHTYDTWHKTADATCTSAEKGYYYCDEHGTSTAYHGDETTTGNALGHTGNNGWVNDPDPTCESTGTKYKTCTRCGSKYGDGVSVPATGHNYSGAVHSLNNGYHNWACSNGCGTYGKGKTKNAKSACNTAAWDHDGPEIYSAHHWKICSICSYDWGKTVEYEVHGWPGSSWADHICPKCKKVNVLGYKDDPVYHYFPDGTNTLCGGCSAAELTYTYEFPDGPLDLLNTYVVSNNGCGPSTGCKPCTKIILTYSHIPYKEKTSTAKWELEPKMQYRTYEHYNWEHHSTLFEGRFWGEQGHKFQEYVPTLKTKYGSWGIAGHSGFEYGTLEGTSGAQPDGNFQTWTIPVTHGGHAYMVSFYNLAGNFDEAIPNYMFKNGGGSVETHTYIERLFRATEGNESVPGTPGDDYYDHDLEPYCQLRYGCPVYGAQHQLPAVSTFIESAKKNHWRLVKVTFNGADVTSSDMVILAREQTNTFIYYFEKMPTLHVSFKTVGGEELTGITYNDVTVSGWQDPSGGNSWYLPNHPDKAFTWSLNGKVNLDTHYRFLRTEISAEGDAWTTGVASSGTPQTGDGRFSGTVTVNPYYERTIIFVYEKMPTIHIIYRTTHHAHPSGTPADDDPPAVIYIPFGGPDKYDWKLGASTNLEDIHYRYLGETDNDYAAWVAGLKIIDKKGYFSETGLNFSIQPGDEKYHKESGTLNVQGEHEYTICFLYERMPEVTVAYRGARGENIPGAPADHHEWLKYNETTYNWNMAGSTISPSGRGLGVSEPDVDLRDDSKYRYRGEQDLGPQSCFAGNTYSGTPLPAGALDGSWYDIGYNFKHSGAISPKGDEDAWVVLIYERDPIVNVIYRDKAGNEINIPGAIEDVSKDYGKKIYLTATPGSGYLNTYAWSTDETADEYQLFFGSQRKEPDMMPYNKAKYRYLGASYYDDKNSDINASNSGFKNIGGMSFTDGVNAASYKDKKDAAGNPLHDWNHSGTITVEPYHEGYVVFVFDIIPRVEIAYRDNEGQIIPGTGKIEDHPIANIKYIQEYDEEYKYDGYNLSYDITKGVELLDTYGWRYNGHMWDQGGTLAAGDATYKNIGQVGALDNGADKTVFLAGHSTDSATGGTYGTRLIQMGEYTHATLNPNDETTDAHLTYVFEPILLTILHYDNTTQQNILTKQNLTMRMPKLTNAGHTDSSLGCSPLEEGNVITHVIRSLNKNAWPGYMLTNYYLGEKAVEYPSQKGYGYTVANSNQLFDTGRTKDQIRSELSSILLEEDSYNATTTTKVDLSNEGWKNAIKQISIKTSAHDQQAGEQVGRRPDIKIAFIYEQLIIQENHLKNTDKTFLKSNREPNQGEDLTKRKVIADNYFTSDSLVLRGDNILTNMGHEMGYNYDGWILKDIGVKPETKEEVSVWAWVVGDDIAAADIDEEMAKRLFCQVRGSYIAQAGGGYIENNTKVNFYYEQRREEEVIVVRHVHERDRRDLLPKVETGFAPGQTEMVLKKSGIIPYDYLYVEIDETTVNDSPEITITPEQHIKTITFVYGDRLPRINVEYRYGDPQGDELFDSEEKQFIKQTINIDNSHPQGKTNEAGEKIEYSYYVLYEGDNIGSGQTDTGTDTTVSNIRNNGNVRLLVFVYGSNTPPPTPDIPQTEHVSGEEINVDFTDILLRSDEGIYTKRDKEQYNVEEGIPTSEDLYANVITDTYLVKEVNNVHLMKKRFHIKVIKQYTETNDSEKDKLEGTQKEQMGEDKILRTQKEFDMDVPYYYNSGRDTIMSWIDHADVHNEVIEWHEDRDETTIPAYSVKEIPWTIESNGIVKGHVRLFPQGPQPTMEFKLGGGLKIKPSYTTVQSTADADGVLQPGIYDIVENADGSYTITYVMGSYGYNLKQTGEDIDKQIQDFKDNPWSLTEQLVKTGTRVISDSLIIDRENGSHFVVWQGDLPLTMTGYTLDGIAKVEEKEGTTVLQIPTKSILNEHILYKDTNLYVNKEKANGTYPTSGDVVYREIKYITSGDDSTGEGFVVTDIEGGQLSTLNSKTNVPGNDVKVHTPVADESYITPSKFDNQSVSVTKEVDGYKNDFHYLVLDGTFKVTIPWGLSDNGNKFNYFGYEKENYVSATDPVDYTGTTGLHNTYNGYKGGSKAGDKDPEVGGAYTTWGTLKDVRIPFDTYFTYVKDGETKKMFLPGNTWLSEGMKQRMGGAENAIKYLAAAENSEAKATIFEFTVPVWVEEKDYYIQTRVIAENAFKISEDKHMPKVADAGESSLYEFDTSRSGKSQPYSNKDVDNYVASNSHRVRVVGYIYDLMIESSSDIDWKNILNPQTGASGGSTGSLRKNKITANNMPFGLTGGTVGTKTIDSQNANTAYKYAPKIGYTFAFSFKTKGRKSNQIDLSILKQGFEFVPKSGKTDERALPVELWYRKGNTGAYIKVGSAQDDTKITVVPNAEYLKVDGNEMMNSTRIYPIEKNHPLVPDNVPYNYGIAVNIGSVRRLTIPHVLRMAYDNFAEYVDKGLYKTSKENIAAHALSTKNASDVNGYFGNETGADRVIGSVGHWYGAYNLPVSTVAVEPGKDPNTNPEAIKRNGYIIVNLGLMSEDISEDTNGEDYLLYTGPKFEFDTYLDEGTDIEWPTVIPDVPEPIPDPNPPEPEEPKPQVEEPKVPEAPQPEEVKPSTGANGGDTGSLRKRSHKTNNETYDDNIKIGEYKLNNNIWTPDENTKANQASNTDKMNTGFYHEVAFPDGTVSVVKNSAIAAIDADNRAVRDVGVGISQ